MKIIIISAVFTPEPLVTAKISNDLADYLSNKDEVIVLAPNPSRPLGTKYSKKTLFTNFTLINLNSFIYPKGAILGRLAESFSFGWECYKYLIKTNAVNLVYMNTWPIFAQLFVSIACLNKKIPYYFHIQDIYPESFTNKLPKYFKIFINTIFIKIDRFIIKKSTKTIVVSPKMLEIISLSRKINKAKFKLIHNWQNETAFDSFFTKWEHSKFTFMYLGNIGPVAGIENLIKAFVSANLNAKLIIAGSGSKKYDCVSLASKLKNADISFINVPEGKVPEIQSIAHVLILPTIKDGAISSIPSKLPAYMFSAKPIFGIINRNSDTANAIIDSEAGWVVEPDDFSGIVKQFKEIVLISHSNLKEIGLSGRNYALINFSKKFNLTQLANCLVN
jgi:glycosyltransferase involved in cell wall biosynthesis